MRLKELLRDVSIGNSRNIEWDIEIDSITDDSREVKNGSLFIAIKGYESDGHDYVKSAIEKGTSVVVCERELPIDFPCIQVEDGRIARAQIACNYFDNPSKSFKVVGVTGTNGKTSVSTMLFDMLEKLGKKVAVLGTNGNYIGGDKIEASRTTPDSIELQGLFAKMREENVEYCLMEVSSHALYLERVHGVQFELGIFTNLTEDHLDFHPTMEEYFLAKAKLFDLSRIGLINTDDKYGRRLKEMYPKAVGFGHIKPAENLVVNKGLDESYFKTSINGVVYDYPRPGKIFRYNMSTVIVALRLLGFDETDVKDLVPTIKAVEGRMEIFGQDLKVVVDYAHTPDALEKIIADVKDFTEGRIITVFGCGGDRDSTKRKIMGEVATATSDFTFITNDNPRTEDPEKILSDILDGVVGDEYTVELNREAAIKKAIAKANVGDSVIVAGKGHETYQIIGKEKIHFDDREIVKEALKENI